MAWYCALPFSSKAHALCFHGAARETNIRSCAQTNKHRSQSLEGIIREVTTGWNWMGEDAMVLKVLCFGKWLKRQGCEKGTGTGVWAWRIGGSEA